MYETEKFTNEGDFLEREKRYEERSNPLMKFIETKCEEVENTTTSLREFTNQCNEYFREKHLRIQNIKQIGKILREEGFIITPRNFMGISSKVIINLRILSKTTKTTNI